MNELNEARKEIQYLESILYRKEEKIDKLTKAKNRAERETVKAISDTNRLNAEKIEAAVKDELKHRGESEQILQKKIEEKRGELASIEAEIDSAKNVARHISGSGSL